MSKKSQFHDEYITLRRKLAGMDEVVDAASIRQLKAAKASLVDSWRDACGNSFLFKAELEQAELDLLGDKADKEHREAVETSIATLTKIGKEKGGK